MRGLLRRYYLLAKPGIIYGNIMTAAAGFLLASRGHIDWLLGMSLLAGTSLVIGSACVINNIIDRDIDSRMARTRKRSLVTGNISMQSAIVYAAVLGCVGLAILIVGTKALTVFVGIIGFVSYVVLYGIGKRRTVHGTLIGTISGATPIVAGYVAVSDQFDMGALILFLIMVFWQMPHFYAIAVYRYDDYAAAHLPVLPVVAGMRTTKIQILAYIAAFVLAYISLTIFGYAGYSYLLAGLCLGAYWLSWAVRGFGTANDADWARKLFLESLIVVTVFSIMLSLDAWLP